MRLAPFVLCCSSVAGFAQEPVTDPRAALEAIREKHEVPALGAALVTVDGLQGLWTTGTRVMDGEERVADDDVWHLGSCTKAMTATLIALLVARGDLAWETPLAELLPELATDMHLDFMELDLADLMGHRAGLPANPYDGLPEDADGAGLSLVEQRSALTKHVLARGPVHPPRGAFLYSNTGFLIAGHVAEVATKKSWEELMRELLFAPLGMQSAGFGPPGTRERCDQPRGHTSDGEPVEPGPEADNPPNLGPAGTVHATLADWAKFIQLHLRGARGDVKVGELTLTKDAFARLHTPMPGAGAQYGYGWVFDKRDWAGGDGTVWWHNGSNTMWYCVSWSGPGHGFAALATTNIFTPESQKAADEAVQLMVKEAEAGRAR